ncbi:MAG: hypothetical protein ACRDP4_09520 [Nocardioidaceae bacterium]
MMTVRVLAALAVLVSAAVHLRLWFDGYNDLSVIGPLFLLNVIAGAVIAGLVVFWRHWLPWLLVFGFGVATLGSFVTSATVGMFGVHEQWQGFYVWAAAIAEAVAIICGLVGAGREGYFSATMASLRTRPSRNQSLHS